MKYIVYVDSCQNKELFYNFLTSNNIPYKLIDDIHNLQIGLKYKIYIMNLTNEELLYAKLVLPKINEFMENFILADRANEIHLL